MGVSSAGSRWLAWCRQAVYLSVKSGGSLACGLAGRRTEENDIVSHACFCQSVRYGPAVSTTATHWLEIHYGCAEMWSAYIRLVALAALCLCTLAQAQSDLFQIGEKRNTPQKYCGRNLADILHLVCNGFYYPMFKKSADLDYDMNDAYWVESAPSPPQEQLPFPYRSRASATTVVNGGFRRRMRGIYDECCRKSCTILELSSYCGKR